MITPWLPYWTLKNGNAEVFEGRPPWGRHGNRFAGLNGRFDGQERMLVALVARKSVYNDGLLRGISL